MLGKKEFQLLGYLFNILGVHERMSSQTANQAVPIAQEVFIGLLWPLILPRETCHRHISRYA